MDVATSLQRIALIVILVGSEPVALAGFTLEGHGASLTVDSRIQAVYAQHFTDVSTGEAAASGDTSDGAQSDEAGADRFYVQQARLNLHGTYGDRFTYRLTAELGNTSVPLRDACIGIRVAPWFKAVVGQFKVPYSFDRLTSGADLLFAWRPEVADAMVPGRDIGVMGDLEGARHHYRFRAGIFTGRGQNMTMDDYRDRPLWAARFDWAPFAPIRSRKNPDVRSKVLALIMGVNVALSDDGEVGPKGPLDSIDGRKQLVGADIAVAFRGLWVSLEGNAAHYTPRDSLEEPYDAAGYVFQLGWYLPRLRVEPAVRFDALDPDSRRGGDLQRALTIGVNAYPTGDSHFKLMVDYGSQLPMDGTIVEGLKNKELRVLLQFVLS